MTPSASPAQRLAAVGTAHALLDIPGVSQRVLGRHWDTCNTDQRQEFTALLTQLLAQVVYPQSAAFFHQLEMRITDEEVKNQSARVRTAVHHPSEGLIEVDYRLRRHQGTWRVSDIILDEVSIATSLRTQVHQIIVRHSYDALLQRMRDKLEAQAPSAQQHATSARH